MFSATPLTRRDWLRTSTAGLVGFSMSGWLRSLAAAVDAPKRSVIVLWMNGGPSQMDTFDPKPGHANGGPIKAIPTSVPGIHIGEHLPRIAQRMNDLAIVRSMTTKEADHGRATYLMHTGVLPQGAIEFPTFGSLVAKELGDPKAELPNFVCVAPIRFFSQTALSPGFLGSPYAPLIVAENQGYFNNVQGTVDSILKVQDLEPPDGVTAKRADDRVGLLKDVEAGFLAKRPGQAGESHRAAYERAVRLMKASAARAFNLAEEPAQIRDKYGRNLFGQGCLLARRLVERGVPFVEVTLAGSQGSPAGWDTHQGNFEAVKSLCSVLDPAWSSLMDDLKQRGLLDSTMVVWMGEFGRTPRINPQRGRDHFATAWTTVLGGGGIKGGQVVGKTSADGMAVTERPVTVPDLLATVCKGIGVDPNKQNMSNVMRPIRIVDKSAKAIEEVLA